MPPRFAPRFAVRTCSGRGTTVTLTIPGGGGYWNESRQCRCVHNLQDPRKRLNVATGICTTNSSISSFKVDRLFFADSSTLAVIA